MNIRQIIHLNRLIGIEILGLVDKVDDRELDLTAYWKYLRDQYHRLGLFGAFDDAGRLLGYLHAEPPTPLFPKRGYLYVAATDPQLGREGAQELFRAMKEWLADNGATYLWGWTRRSPRAINRLYGFEVVKERQVVCPISGDDYLKVEREEPETSHV